MNMSPGTHIVKIKNCGMTGEGDKIQPFITFVADDGATITWYASLTSEKSREYAIQNVVRVGFIGRGWSDFSLDKIADPDKQFEIEVKERIYKDKVSIQVSKIGFVRTVKVAKASELKGRFASSEADFALYRAKNKVSVTKPSDDIPF